MATLAVSPRRATTTAEKADRDAQYRVKDKEFGEILKSFVAIFNSLVLLNTALGQAGKGAFLAFPNPTPGQEGTSIPFNRKHLRSANAKFAKSILLLKNYLRASRKKTRDPVLPESFSGTYTPVYAGEALRSLFNPANNFGALHPAQGGDPLIASLGMATQGYLLRNTSTMLFYIYAHANELQAADNAQFASSDQAMMTAFGGKIPAAFYSYKQGGKSVKVPMEQAVAQGLIRAPLNTYDVIRVSHPTFNPARFNTYFYQNIAASNYYSKAALAAEPALAAAAEALAQDDVRQAMLAEHNLVKQVSAEWHDILEPGRKVQRDARKKEQDAIKKAQRAQVR